MTDNSIAKIVEKAIAGMDDAQKKQFAEIFDSDMPAIIAAVAQKARGEQYNFEQAALESEYSEKIKGIRRGNLVGISQVQAEMQAKGWQSGQLHAERPAAPTQEQVAAAQGEQDELRRQYEARRRQIGRGPDLLKQITELQIEFRNRGLEV